MRIARLVLLAAVPLAGATGGALPAQEGAPQSYALALKARYLPLESVREGIVRMPKPLARPVSVRRQGALLQQVLLDIATQAGLGLSYGEDLARSQTHVTLELTNATAAEALALATRDTKWAVMVTPSGQVAVVPAERQQLGIVAGRVTDRASGFGLPGASVTLEGTRLGATADDSGRYRIANIPPGSYTLAVRRIGYARATRQVEVVADRTTGVDVALEATASTLDQIVVTGVPGATSKRTLGNAITTIDAAEATQRAVNVNVTELLQGKAPGVQIAPGGGSPGTGALIRIRGAGSLVGATTPVIYVDGVRLYSGAQGAFWNSWRSQGPMEGSAGNGQDAMALDMLNPNDIESIEVIKGPAAATLYGADAANGVIQIITKKGKVGDQPLEWTAKALAGRTDWNVDRVTNYTTCTPAVMAARLEGQARFPGCEGKTPGTILSATSMDLPGALRDGDVSNYALSLRGGGPAYSFFLAGDRDREEGVFLNSNNGRSSARANFAFFPNAKLDLAVNVGYGRVNTQFPINDDGYGLFQAALLYRPGELPVDEPGRQDGFQGGNGPERVYQWDNRLKAARLTFGTTINYQPVSWFKNRLTVGVDQNERLANKYLPPQSIWSTIGSAEEGAPRNTLNTVDYAGTFDTALPFTSLTSALSFGAQYTTNQYRNTVGVGSGFASDQIRQVALAAQTISWNESVDQKSLGLYVQEQVGWRDRLYLTGALRVDNSSVFGEEIEWLAFPKLSASWVISEEPFLANAGWLDQLKLRMAWGQAGNAPAPFAGQRSFTSGPNVTENGELVPALRTNAYGNPKIKPERGTELELGFDASFLAGRLGLELTYYDKTTKDALMRVAVPPSTGFPGDRLENLGEISNSGFEIAVTGTPLQNRVVTWDSRLNLSTNRNRLEEFGFERGPIGIALYGEAQRHQPGYPLGGYWGNFPKRGANGELLRDAQTGALLPPDSAVYVGPSIPTREASLSNTFTLFRNFRVHTLLDYRGGNRMFNVKDAYRCFGQPFANVWNNDASKNIPGQCWEVNDPGRSAESKEILQQPLEVNSGVWMQKADFIKLRDVSLTYTAPHAWASRLGVARAAITVAGHNLGFLWKPDYTGPDPEVNFAGVSDANTRLGWTRVDSWTAPMTRRLTAAIELTF